KADAERRGKACVGLDLGTRCGIANALPRLPLVLGAGESQRRICSPYSVDVAVVRTPRIRIGVDPLLVVGGVGMELDGSVPGLTAVLRPVHVHAHARDVGSA